jgi:hypothetical protein
VLSVGGIVGDDEPRSPGWMGDARQDLHRHVRATRYVGKLTHLLCHDLGVSHQPVKGELVKR